jgi:murein DD-endopeptidase MepM/ murein hydrolase activator NlpD
VHENGELLGIVLALAGLLLGAVLPSTTTAVAVPGPLGDAGGTGRAAVIAAVGEPTHHRFEHAMVRAPAGSEVPGVPTDPAAGSETSAPPESPGALTDLIVDPAASVLPEIPPALGVPVAGATVTSLFGHRVNPLDGSTPEFHTGVDYGSPCGTDVVAAGAGVVTESGWHDYGGGHRVAVDHGGGLQTTYNHLSVPGAPVGEVVQRGNVVGSIGSTGSSTGCHLHFEVLLDARKVDPLPWLQPSG